MCVCVCGVVLCACVCCVCVCVQARRGRGDKVNAAYYNTRAGHSDDKLLSVLCSINCYYE